MHSPSHVASNQTEQQFPRVYSQPRLLWTAELHRRFVVAISLLGGIDQAKPKMILERMNVLGVTIINVKSHLQKYRRDVKLGNKLPPPVYAISDNMGFQYNVASPQHEFMDLNRPVPTEAYKLFRGGERMMHLQNNYGAQRETECNMNFEDRFGAPYQPQIYPGQRINFQYQHQNNGNQMDLYLGVQQHYTNTMLEQSRMMLPSNGRT